MHWSWVKERNLPMWEWKSDAKKLLQCESSLTRIYSKRRMACWLLLMAPDWWENAYLYTLG